MDSVSRSGGGALRSGFTTGTAAAAAAKGALTLLLDPEARPRRGGVSVPLPDGGRLTIPIHALTREGPDTAVCSVIKDAGDDPDVTHRAEIGAVVTIRPPRFPDFLETSEVSSITQSSLLIVGGRGVGRVTKPGLAVAPGEPAINPVPRRMIAAAVDEALAGREIPVRVEIFVPEGERLAEKTLNRRLGIIGGISILGTTGIVRPLSHDAYIASVRSALSVAAASGLDTVVLTTGRRSERLAQARWPDWPEEAFIQMGDFFKDALTAAVANGLKAVILAVFFGKAVKMASGAAQTHASRSRLALSRLAEWTLSATGDQQLADEVAGANTARHAFDLVHPVRPAVIERVGDRMVRAAAGFAGPDLSVRGVIFGYDETVGYDSAGGSVR